MALHSVVSSGVWLIPEQKQQELFPLPFGAKKAASFQKTFQKQCLQQNTFARISSTTWKSHHAEARVGWSLPHTHLKVSTAWERNGGV